MEISDRLKIHLESCGWDESRKIYLKARYPRLFEDIFQQKRLSELKPQFKRIERFLSQIVDMEIQRVGPKNSDDFIIKTTLEFLQYTDICNAVVFLKNNLGIYLIPFGRCGSVWLFIDVKGFIYLYYYGDKLRKFGKFYEGLEKFIFTDDYIEYVDISNSADMVARNLNEY